MYILVYNDNFGKSKIFISENLEAANKVLRKVDQQGFKFVNFTCCTSDPEVITYEDGYPGYLSNIKYSNGGIEIEPFDSIELPKEGTSWTLKALLRQTQ
jgi:hypothetical protein